MKKETSQFIKDIFIAMSIFLLAIIIAVATISDIEDYKKCKIDICNNSDSFEYITRNVTCKCYNQKGEITKTITKNWSLK